MHGLADDVALEERVVSVVVDRTFAEFAAHIVQRLEVNHLISLGWSRGSYHRTGSSDEKRLPSGGFVETTHQFSFIFRFMRRVTQNPVKQSSYRLPEARQFTILRPHRVVEDGIDCVIGREEHAEDS